MSDSMDDQVDAQIETAVSFDQMSGVEADGSFGDSRYGRVTSGTSTPTMHYVNAAGLSESEMGLLKNNNEIASVIENWSAQLSAGAPVTNTSPDLFNRQRFSGRRTVFTQIASCAFAVETDDILSTLADVTEGLMWAKCRFELNDDDEEDVWNQWAAMVDLDTTLRQMSRELYKVSQVYVGVDWGQHVFTPSDDTIDPTIKAAVAERDGTEYTTPRGNTSRRRKFPLRVPVAFTVYDPTKVVPVGSLLFGRERFAYVADRGEHEGFSAAMRGDTIDPTVLNLIERQYRPTPSEASEFSDLGIDPEQLWLFKVGSVFRHTLTRANYERFAQPRLKSILPILEMKHNLRAADRATLIGQTNFLIVITKGSDKLPAKASEIENLKEQTRMIARLPVLVGDHRLNVEIVSPTTDNTLIESRWQVLDSRLVFAALNTFQPIVQGGSATTGVSEMSRIVATGLENRRHMIYRALQKNVFGEIMTRNEGVLKESPTLAFNPRRISLDFNKDIAALLFKLRDRGDLSRETTLDEFNFDQDTEALRRAREMNRFDPVFKTAVPFSSPGANPFGGDGQGGNGQGANGQLPPGAKNGSTPEGGRPVGVTETSPRKARDAASETASADDEFSEQTETEGEQA